MKSFFEHSSLKLQDPTDLDIDQEDIDGLLVEAQTIELELDELGEITLDPEILRSAVELPHHRDLKPEYRGMYVRYGSSCSGQHWGTPNTVRMAVNLAYNWWKQIGTPTILLGDISAKNFSQTGCHMAHKSGTHLDVDLAGTLPKDPNYNLSKKKKCAVLCWFGIQLGVKRILFSDAEVAKAVNELAEKKGFSGRVRVRADHDDHFHIEM